jgi:hypothetical protein
MAAFLECERLTASRKLERHHERSEWGLPDNDTERNRIAMDLALASG